MGIFSTIKTATGGTAKTYVPSGYKGLVTIARCKLVTSKKPGDTSQYFVMEGNYETVETGDVEVGGAATVMFRINPDPYGYGMADTRAALAAACGVSESDIDPDAAQAACGVDGDGTPIPGDGGTLLAGNSLHVQGIGQIAKSGSAYTKFQFTAAQ
tara:strand:+ start:313 stop:780 length:468 start_codon:yes stop_codon:yes gene_type:complete